MIEGVEIKELVTHSDERGFFREVLRVTDPIFDGGFGQWSYAKRSIGTGEWHLHQHQTDWWHVPIGAIEAVLRDDRIGSLTYGKRSAIPLIENEVLKIPPGVAHGFKIVYGPMYLFYITSHIYDPDDEGRLPYTDEDKEWVGL